MKRISAIAFFLVLTFTGLFSLISLTSLSTVLIVLMGIVSAFLVTQSIFSIFLMIYAWEDPRGIEKNKSPKKKVVPHLSFSALIPARHEDKVIKDTIEAVSRIHYPEGLKEILVICRIDDTKTIDEVTRTIQKIGRDTIKLVLFGGYPINKPRGLNVALSEAKGDIIVVFDAEDEPHTDIYSIINTVMMTKNADVVQSGVQLMNYSSSWFSVLNVLEYYFWYKSWFQYYASCGIVPLGGNTIFFKREWLTKIGGWDQNCLTEDADIGIRLSLAGAKIRVVYDEEHTTREETPPNVVSFIKQRTRWNQGWIQVLLKGDWTRIPTFRKKLLGLYILIWPEIQAFLFLYLPLSVLMILFVKLPVWLALFMSLPLYIIFVQIVLYTIGLYEFTKDYKLKFPLWAPLLVLLVFYPYQVVLGFSAARALFRALFGLTSWEKTLHINAHRTEKISVSNI